MSKLTIDSANHTNTAATENEAASPPPETAAPQSAPVAQPPADTVEAAMTEAELATADDRQARQAWAPAAGGGMLSPFDTTDLDQQLALYRLEQRLGQQTIAEPNTKLGGDSIATVEAAQVDDAARELDAAMKRGKELVTTAGRRAAGKDPQTSRADEAAAVADMGASTFGGLWDAAHGLVSDGAPLASRAAFGLGAAAVGAAAVSVVAGIGGAHQDAHAFNEKEGYAHGYAKGYAAALYGEAPSRHRVKGADNSKKQTYDFAYNDGTRRGYADAMRLSEADKAAARMYIESQMADNNEEYMWGDSDTSGAYVKQAGAWYSELLP